MQQFDFEWNNFQCWKRIYISWMIVGNYTSYTKSDFYEIVNDINNSQSQPLPVKCDFWLGLVAEWLEQRKVWTVLIELP